MASRVNPIAITQLRAALVAAVEKLLATRKVRCSRRCRGWFVDSETTDVHRCDECASSNGYAGHVDDLDVALLPAAQKARLRMLRGIARAQGKRS